MSILLTGLTLGALVGITWAGLRDYLAGSDQAATRRIIRELDARAQRGNTS